jgi:hypothetical protein
VEVAVQFENRMELTDTLFGRNDEPLNVKAGGTYSYHCVLAYSDVALIQLMSVSITLE